MWLEGYQALLRWRAERSPRSDGRTPWVKLGVLWVGVRCDAAMAAALEVARDDGTVGMAACQAEVVQRGVTYDLEVDSRTEAMECAGTIAARVD